MSARETDYCVSKSSVNWISNKFSRMNELSCNYRRKARNCAANVKIDIRGKFQVQGLVRPDVGTYVLANLANNDIMTLLKSNPLISCGSANDVGMNNSTKALKHITDFIETNNQTNIIIVTIPPWYDLMQSSFMNSEIK